MDPSSPLTHLRDLAAHGESARLAEALEALVPGSLEDRDLSATADLAEEAELPHVVGRLLSTLRDRGTASSEELLRLASLATSEGRDEDALALVEEALAGDPHHREAAREKIFLLARLGLPEEGERFLEERSELFGPTAPSLREVLRGPERSPAPGTDPGPDPAPSADVRLTPSRETPTWTEAHLHRMLTLFRGREEVHARQWISPSGGAGYSPVEAPLLPSRLDAHLRGEETLGVYQLDGEGRVHWIAFDVDIRREELTDGLRHRGRWQNLLRQAWNTAAALADLLAVEGFHPVLEYSGFKGYHVWIFLDRPLPAAVARAAAQAVVGHLDEVPPEIAVEIFPKQSRLQGKQLGNLVKLPLGLHLRTRRRSTFVGEGARPLDDPFEALMAIRRTRSEAVAALARPVHASPAGDALFTPSRAVPADGDPFDPPFTADRPEARPGTEGDPGMLDHPRIQQLLSRCHVLSELVEKARATCHLTHEEQLALVHTLGHLEGGPAAVNALLGILQETSPELMLKSRLRGHPVSCAKLRARVRPSLEGNVLCDCDFGPSPATYPNPLLHLDPHPPGSMAPSSLPAPGGPLPGPEVQDGVARLEALVRRYLDVRLRRQRLEAEFTELEAELRSLFTSQQLEAIPTPLGTLRRASGPEGTERFVLEL